MKYARLFLWLVMRTYRVAKTVSVHAAVLTTCAVCVLEDAIRHGMSALYIWRAEVDEARAAAAEQAAVQPVAEFALSELEG